MYANVQLSLEEQAADFEGIWCCLSRVGWGDRWGLGGVEVGGGDRSLLSLARALPSEGHNHATFM